jgi:hypothetical protein
MSEGINNKTKIIAAIIISFIIGVSIGYLLKTSATDTSQEDKIYTLREHYEKEIFDLSERVDQLEKQISELQTTMLPEPIKIGQILPLTGSLGVYSEGFVCERGLFRPIY